MKHTETLGLLKNKIINGNCLEIIPYLPDECIHLTFTSPPYYNARDYVKYESYEDYLSLMEIVFKQAYRLTKEGRFLVLNTSPIIEARESRAKSSKRYPIPYDLHPILKNIGWEFIDDIYWVKPNSAVKNRNGGFFQHRKPLGYKPNAVTENLLVYRKPTNKLIDWNIKQYNADIINRSLVKDDYEQTNIWEIKPRANKEHPAVFPYELARKVITYYSYVDDLIFDPFGGIGTCAEEALDTNRHFLLIEKQESFAETAYDRIGEIYDLWCSPNAHTRPAKLTQPEFIDLLQTQ